GARTIHQAQWSSRRLCHQYRHQRQDRANTGRLYGRCCERPDLAAADQPYTRPGIAPSVTVSANRVQRSTLLAAKNATSKIPIVFVDVGDPVGMGFVTSLAKPRGNITGFSNFSPSSRPSNSSCFPSWFQGPAYSHY